MSLSHIQPFNFRIRLFAINSAATQPTHWRALGFSLPHYRLTSSAGNWVGSDKRADNRVAGPQAFTADKVVTFCRV